MDHEIHYKILRHLEDHPDVSQRQLARKLGVSLGKTNYCLKALIGKGFVKAQNFRNSPDKRAYLYILTPEGLEAKMNISVSFLKHKMLEHEQLKHEIQELWQEVQHVEEER